MSSADFEAFVRRELGDIAVMDDGRYISPKIQKYWLTWCAATERAARIAESDEFYGSVVPVAIAVAIRGEPKPPQLTPEQEAVAKRAWAMAHEIMWEGTNLRIEDVERATLREKPDLSTDVLRGNSDLSTGALIEAQAITGRQLMARLSAGEAFINAPARVCDETDVVCSRGCGAWPCKAKE